MAINYTWNVKRCDVFPTKSGKSNVVHNVHWRLTATDDANNDSDGNPITAEMYGSQVSIKRTNNRKSYTNISTKNIRIKIWNNNTL